MGDDCISCSQPLLGNELLVTQWMAMMISGKFLTPRGILLQDIRTWKLSEHQRKEIDLGRHTEMTVKFSAANSRDAIPSVRIVAVLLMA